MRRLLQPVWFLLALIFLVEAWLWDHLQPVVARVVAWIPLREIKAWIAEKIEHLSPPLTLIVFLIPAALLFPLKVAGLWLLAHHYWFSAMAVVVFAKLLGVGVAAFIFDVTRPKLLQMAWFKWVYETVLMIRAKAHALVAPVMTRIKARLRWLRAGSSSRWVRMIQRIRHRVQSAR
jgi:hypothetical protein